MSQQAPVIVSSESPFASDVFAKRHPALIDRLTGAWPFGLEQRRALSELGEEGVHGVIRRLPDSAVDAQLWREWGSPHYGRRWIEALNNVANLAEDERGQALLLSSLWGNRADLALQITAGRGIQASGLVGDDSERLWKLLRATPGGTVAVVADNAGSEMVADLALIDHLLTHGLAGNVVLHVKPTPYYVSDATLADVSDCLRALLLGKGEARAVGERLREAAAVGQLQVRTDGFWCAPFDFAAMPVCLRSELAAATVTILKGDLNYRRLVGDRWWEPTTLFAEAAGYFPGRVAALRTLKSDVIVGLRPEKLAELEDSGTGWRTAGTHALIQVRS